jgi:hypothetical protein
MSLEKVCPRLERSGQINITVEYSQKILRATRLDPAGTPATMSLPNAFVATVLA